MQKKTKTAIAPGGNISSSEDDDEFSFSLSLTINDSINDSINTSNRLTNLEVLDDNVISDYEPGGDD